MNGKSIPSEYPRTSTFASRLRSFATKIRLKVWLAWIAAFLVVCLAVFIEFRTSILQSWIFTSTNQRLFFTLKDGPSNEIAFPRAGPFDERRGYSKLPFFQSRLDRTKLSGHSTGAAIGDHAIAFRARRFSALS